VSLWYNTFRDGLMTLNDVAEKRRGRPQINADEFVSLSKV
jgi:hypothetical protein